MSWNNAWIGGNQPPAPSGLMAPWSTSWGMTPENMIQNEVAPALRGASLGGGEAKGYSTPGNPATAAQTSQATKDRVRGSLTGSLTGNVVNAGLKTGLGLGLGMPGNMVGPAALGSLASPGAVGNVLGGAVNAALGTTPQGWGAKAVANYGVPALAGMAFGPVGGLVGGLMGGVVADGIGDAFGMRRDEALRDDMENKSGYVGGRTGYADLQSYAEKANSLEAAVKGMVDKVNVSRAIAGIDPIGYSPRGVSPGRMEVGAPGTQSYGGWGNVGGPTGGARAVDRGYGANMGGFAGLGIGNPSSYGGGSSSSSGGGNGGKSSGGGGGYGGHAGGKDGSSSGFGR